MAQSSGMIIALTIVFTVLAVVFVCLRIWSRKLAKLALLVDDWLSVSAVTLLVGTLTVPLMILAVQENLGNHVHRGPSGHALPATYRFNVCEMVLEVGGYIPIAFAKASTLFFYRRIFVGNLFTVVVWITLGLVVGWCAAFTFAEIFQCVPVTASLKSIPGTPGIKCVNQLDMFYAGAAGDVAIDLIIFFIPWPILYNMNMRWQRKIAVCGIFLLGALTIAASIARLVEFVRAGRQRAAGNEDYTYYVAPPAYWTLLECSLAIVVTCLPTLRAVLRLLGSKLALTTKPVRSMMSSSTSTRAKKSNYASEESTRSRRVEDAEKGERCYPEHAGQFEDKVQKSWSVEEGGMLED